MEKTIANVVCDPGVTLIPGIAFGLRVRREGHEDFMVEVHIRILRRGILLYEQRLETLFNLYAKIERSSSKDPLALIHSHMCKHGIIEIKNEKNLNELNLIRRQEDGDLQDVDLADLELELSETEAEREEMNDATIIFRFEHTFEPLELSLQQLNECIRN